MITVTSSLCFLSTGSLTYLPPVLRYSYSSRLIPFSLSVSPHKDKIFFVGPNRSDPFTVNLYLDFLYSFHKYTYRPLSREVCLLGGSFFRTLGSVWTTQGPCRSYAHFDVSLLGSCHPFLYSNLSFLFRSSTRCTIRPLS